MLITLSLGNYKIVIAQGDTFGDISDCTLNVYNPDGSLLDQKRLNNASELGTVLNLLDSQLKEN